MNGLITFGAEGRPVAHGLRTDVIHEALIAKPIAGRVLEALEVPVTASGRIDGLAFLVRLGQARIRATFAGDDTLRLWLDTLVPVAVEAVRMRREVWWS